MRQHKLGATGPTVSALSLGCMGMSGIYGPSDRVESIATIHAALDAGVTLFDTGDFYGMGHNEMLLGEALRSVPREAYQLSVKFGSQRDPSGKVIGFDCRPSGLKTALAYSLQRLGVDYIDVYRPARLDPAIPIEETIGAIAEMVHAGFVRHIGLSEVGIGTIRRAAATHPIADLQIEYSLFSRDIESQVLPTLRELGIGVTAYSVLSRGLIGGNWRKDTAQPGDWRNDNPRFQQGNFDRNLALVEALRLVAERRGTSVVQIAIAWVAAQGTDIVPTIGSRRLGQLAESVAALELKLSADDLADIEHAVPKDSVAGDRYAKASMAHVNK